MSVDIENRIDPEKTWNEGMADLPAFHVGNWYWKQYAQSGLFPLDKKWKDFTETERNRLLYGADTPDGPKLSKRVEGVSAYLHRMLLHRDTSELKEASVKRLLYLVKEETCPLCHGKRLSQQALSCKVAGYTIDQMCDMEFTELVKVLETIDDPRAKTMVDTLCASLHRMSDIGLPYLCMSRESATLSGGEAQRLKLVRYMGSSLTGMTYIFDEPSTGMHPRDVHCMTKLLRSLRDKGNTVLVVEHDKDVISIADEVIDVGPLAGKNGGRILFQGSYENLLLSDTLTGRAMCENIPLKQNPRIPTEFLPVRNAAVHNLKNVSVDIPLNVLTVVTGVAGSGKSSLMEYFQSQYPGEVISIRQKDTGINLRSTPATYLDIADDIRALFAKANKVAQAYFSFNSKGGCPACQGKGVIVSDMAYMDSIETVCEVCGGTR